MDERQEIQDWLEQYFSSPDSNDILITALLALQDRFGYLPREGIRLVAHKLDHSPAQAFGVATFYNHFRHTPPGKHQIKMCMGTACHIKQADKILKHWERKLGIGEGEVTPDRNYSLDRVACVGCCTLAPVALVDDEVIPEISPSRVEGILLGHERDQANTEEEAD